MHDHPFEYMVFPMLSQSDGDHFWKKLTRSIEGMDSGQFPLDQKFYSKVTNEIATHDIFWDFFKKSYCDWVNIFFGVWAQWKSVLGIIHLVHTQSFPEIQYYLPPDTHACA